MPSVRNVSRAACSSPIVVLAKRFTLTYPTFGATMKAASTEKMGMTSRMISNSSRSDSPSRRMPTTTRVPFGPLSFFITSSFVMPTPATFSPSTVTMRSPAMMPSRSDGPPGMGLTTMMVSLKMLNCTPMPSKLPLSGSSASFSSSAGM